MIKNLLLTFYEEAIYIQSIKIIVDEINKAD